MAQQIPLVPMSHLSEARCPEDDWAGISESAARKKRQNRLNQRAYRRRKAIKESALWVSNIPIQDPPAVSHNYGVAEEVCMGIISKFSIRPVAISTIRPELYTMGTEYNTSSHKNHGESRHSLSSNSYRDPNKKAIHRDSESRETVITVSVGPTTIKFNPYEHCPLPADHLLTLVRYNLYRACAANALSLGLDPRAMHDDIPSPFNNLATCYSLTHPPSLYPTERQLTTIHHPYIDLFPFPRVRDNLLAAGDMFDDEELCADLGGKNSVEEHTGLIVWGEPWDPTGWEVSVHVARKWAWLFSGCDELLMATDFWRRQRGEPSLVEILG